MAHTTRGGWLVAAPIEALPIFATADLGGGVLCGCFTMPASAPLAVPTDLERLYRWHAFANDVLRPAIWLVGAVIVGVAGTIGFAAAVGWLG
jgi:hypothetical protein